MNKGDYGMEYIAHSSPDGVKIPHLLEEHTRQVYEKAVLFSRSFDHFGITGMAAIAHDIGKKSDEFQAYMKADVKKRGSVKHALGGTLLLDGIGGPRSLLAGLIVAGHHSGLPDLSVMNSKRIQAVPYLKKVAANSQEEKEVIVNFLRNSTPFERSLEKYEDQFYTELLTKMCFSSLVDADFLDTEAYMDDQKRALRERVSQESMERLKGKLHLHMGTLTSKSASSTLIEMRQQVFHDCIQAGNEKNAFRSLNVPTGVGKTLASMGYALEHAVEFKKKRIIVAIPYTSIIDQNAAVYKNVFGDENVLEHHSMVESKEDGNEQMTVSRLASENWDRPIVVTTTVQLFESLFSNKTSKCRKLHNIADSIIVLDEFQSLPIHVLKPIFVMLNALIKEFNVTVLVSSATPLSFQHEEMLSIIGMPKEIVANNESLFLRMKRVEYIHLNEKISHQSLAEQLASHSQVLCIMNTKKDALKLYEGMRRQDIDKKHLFHLSTSMVPYHRKKTLKKIRENLLAGNQIYVLSTQLIEAGVDLDFPVVYRVMGPMDSIVQAAGRCNREGKYDKGYVYIFDLIEGGMPLGVYQKGTEETRRLLREGTDCLHELNTYDLYFRGLYDHMGEQGLDEYGVLSVHPFQFNDSSSRFRMIDQQTISLLCIDYKDEEAQKEIVKLLNEKQFMPYLTREWFRKAQSFSVNVFETSAYIREHKGELVPIADGWYVWKGKYSMETGITTSIIYDPDKLVY